MNIDITNIGHYRLTSHGGRAYDLYNRATDAVFSISKETYMIIKGNPTIETCRVAEGFKD